MRRDSKASPGGGAGAAEGGPGGLGMHLDPGERVLIDTRPSPLFIPLWPAGTILAILLAGAALAWGGAWTGVAGWSVVAGWALAAGAARLAWQAADWLMRRYVLTDRRVLAMRGVLRRHVVDLPLERVQHVTQFRSLRERIFGLGTIGFATAGTGVTEVYWLMVPGPHATMRRVRGALGECSTSRARARGAPGSERSADRPRARPLVIGLAGGVGSGKSTVARILEELGCVVSDSDAQARAALDLAEVRERLVAWWGEGILGADGRVDRGRVARIVFEDEAERKKLESLVHPIVRARRMDDLERAREAGAPALVIDAPLLYEAGVDRECDAVVFVDAPEPVREERVRRERGWGAGELSRRERAQIPVDEKRRRADEVIRNDGDRQSLARRTGEVLRRVLERTPRDGREGRGAPRRGEGGGD